MTKHNPVLPSGTLVPNHLAIICDGNRRWARAHGLPTFMGHQKGFDRTPEIARVVRSMGIHTLSFWAFSTENWDRSQEEIDFLMKKYEGFVDMHLAEAKREQVRIIHLGRKDRLPGSLMKKIGKAEEQTKNYKKYVLNICLDYGGRDEIVRVVQKVIQAGIKPEAITEQSLAGYFDTYDQPYPYPDLLLRTSGEQRTSGMFCWQAAYAELYWLAEHFPDLSPEKIWEAVVDYSKRRRRFGGNDTVPKVKFDPKKLAKLEVGWWKAHFDHDQSKLAKGLVGQVREQYSLDNRESEQAIECLTEAVGHHDLREWDKAVVCVEKYYQMVKEKTQYAYSPEVVARLEVEYWKIHDLLEENQDKGELEEVFRKLYGEIYRLSDFQARKIGHLKMLATLEHDLAEKANGKGKKYWQKAEEYLVKSYQALREVAS